MFKENWNACSKYDNRFKLNNELNLGDVYDYFMSKRITTFVLQDTSTCSKKYEESDDDGLDLDLLTGHLTLITCPGIIYIPGQAASLRRTGQVHCWERKKRNPFHTHLPDSCGADILDIIFNL